MREKNVNPLLSSAALARLMVGTRVEDVNTSQSALGLLVRCAHATWVGILIDRGSDFWSLML